VVWRGHGLLIEGPSGAGKSDLALRLLEAGGSLVADDLVLVERRSEHLIASAPALPGHLEVRGLGIVVLPHLASARLDRVVRLAPSPAMPRLPEPLTTTILGIALGTVTLDPTAASALARLALALDLPHAGPAP